MRSIHGFGLVKLLRLPANERRYVGEAVAQLVRSSLELRLLPRSRTVALLGTVATSEARGRTTAPMRREAELIGSTVARVAGRLPWHPTCLRQALAVQRMLRRRCIVSRLHLGVTGIADGAAHAWVTVDGHPIVGRPGVERFVPLAAFG